MLFLIFMRFNKRGISPLIATVLLIGFTVALAAVVITWGSGFVNRITTSTDTSSTNSFACTNDLDFQISKVTCGATGTVLIDNRGNIDIVSLSVRLFDISGNPSGTTSSVTFTPVGTATNIVGKFELKSVPNVNSAPATLNIPVGTAKVEAIATIKVNGQNVVCSSAVRDKSFTPC